MIAVAVTTVGLAIAITGGYIEYTNVGIDVENVILVAVGILHIFIGAMMMVNSAVILEKNELKLQNLFGLQRVAYPHDGLESITVVEEQIHILHNGRRAAVTRIQKRYLHKGDWDFMLDALDKAREMAEKVKKT